MEREQLALPRTTGNGGKRHLRGRRPGTAGWKRPFRLTEDDGEEGRLGWERHSQASVWESYSPQMQEQNIRSGFSQDTVQLQGARSVGD